MPEAEGSLPVSSMKPSKEFTCGPGPAHFQRERIGPSSKQCAPHHTEPYGSHEDAKSWVTWNMAGKIDCGASGGPLRDGHVALSREQPQAG